MTGRTELSSVDVAGAGGVAAAGVHRLIKCQLPPRFPFPRRQAYRFVVPDPVVVAPLAVLVRANPGNRPNRTNRAPLRQHRRDAVEGKLAVEEARLGPAVERRHLCSSLLRRLVRAWRLHRQGPVRWLVQSWCRSDLPAALRAFPLMRSPMIAFR